MARQRRRQVRSRRESSGGSWTRWLVAALLVAALGGFVWWWFRLRPAPSKAPAPAVQPPARVLPPTSVVAPIVVPPVVLPPAEEPPPTVIVSTNIVRTPLPAPAEPESLTVVDPPAVGTPAPATEKASTWLTAQLALVSRGISPGSIDGVGGGQTIEALRAFQMDHRLEANGRLDPETTEQLTLTEPSFTEFIVTAQHLARLHRLPTTWLGKSSVPALDFESLAELVGEAAQCHPGYLRRLNPAVDWDHPREGLHLKVPAAKFPPVRRAALIRISLAGKWLRAFDDGGRLLAHFPCSIAARVEKRPIGGLAVAVAVKDPNYTFDPDIFPESAEARTLNRRLIIPPGPNNPVGVAWIGLNRPGYGIHGTPSPEQVGRTESHGCFRLANWNAEYLRQMSWVGLRVSVER